MTLEGGFLDSGQRKKHPDVQKKRGEVAQEIRTVRARRDVLIKEEGTLSHRAKKFFGKNNERVEEIVRSKALISEEAKTILKRGTAEITPIEAHAEDEVFQREVLGSIRALTEFYGKGARDPQSQQPSVALDMQVLSQVYRDRELARVMLWELTPLYRAILKNNPESDLRGQIEQLCFRTMDTYSVDAIDESAFHSDSDAAQRTRFEQITQQNSYLQFLSVIAGGTKYRLDDAKQAQLRGAIERIYDGRHAQVTQIMLSTWHQAASCILSHPGDSPQKRALYDAAESVFELQSKKAGIKDKGELNFLLGGAPEILEHFRPRIDAALQATASITLDDVRDRYFDDSPEGWSLSLREIEVGSLMGSCAELEQRMSGSVRQLMKNYGIKEFYRYPTEALIAQLQEEAIDQPYGVVIFPRGDYNGAFDQQRPAIESVFTETRGRHALKIFEASSSIQIARHLIHLKERYPNNKISFALLGGHGAPDFIQLSNSEAIRREHVSHAGHQRVANFFVDNPTIILSSCSTGQKNGIAAAIGQILGAEVLAPDIDTSLQAVSVTYDEKRPIFTPTYSNGAKTMKYSGSAP